MAVGEIIGILLLFIWAILTALGTFGDNPRRRR